MYPATSTTSFEETSRTQHRRRGFLELRVRWVSIENGSVNTSDPESFSGDGYCVRGMYSYGNGRSHTLDHLLQRREAGAAWIACVDANRIFQRASVIGILFPIPALSTALLAQELRIPKFCPSCAFGRWLPRPCAANSPLPRVLSPPI